MLGCYLLQSVFFLLLAIQLLENNFPNRNNFPKYNIYYTKDFRTNLCFAIYSDNFTGGMVNVPCSLEVENNLIK